MRRALLVLLAICFVSVPALAVDPGKAAGFINVDGNRIKLSYAYAVNHQKNEVTNRDDDTRVVLTDKALPDGVKLEDTDNSFPEGILGLVVCVTHDDKVSHVIVQHPKGMYDAGYFDDNQNYQFKRVKGERHTIAGDVSSRKMTTNTMTFWFDVDFNATMK